MELNYPAHEHPHGITDTRPDEHRLWVCDECGHFFADEEIREEEPGWGHACKQHPCGKEKRCESHLEPYMPELGRDKFKAYLKGVPNPYYPATNEIETVAFQGFESCRQATIKGLE